MSASPVPIDQVLSVGVEEEFLLADRLSRFAAPRAAAVAADLVEQLGDRVQDEFYATQIEINSAARMTAGALRVDLIQARRLGIAAAARAGCLLVASGSAVLTHRPLPVNENPRYAAMARRFASVADSVECEPSGCHIHLGSLDHGEALMLANHLRPWLPVLQALAANSPFAAGRDRGCSSWRYFGYRLWPTVGPAPLVDEAAYDRLVKAMVDFGTIIDHRMVYWYARPSEHVPTVEIRVMDVNPDVDLVLLLALLARGLATTLLAESRHDVPCPRISRALVLQGHQSGAESGLAGFGFNPATGTVTSMRACLDSLIRRSRPGLAAAGDLEAVGDLLAALRARGTGAARQRADFQARRSLCDVVDGLAHRAAAELEDGAAVVVPGADLVARGVSDPSAGVELSAGVEPP